jgi:hypothetical protein
MTPDYLRAIIPIEINGKIFDYHIICTIATEGISINPNSIDFGTVDIGYSSGLKAITIYNKGGQSTKYQHFFYISKTILKTVRNKIIRKANIFLFIKTIQKSQRQSLLQQFIYMNADPRFRRKTINFRIALILRVITDNINYL